MFRLFVACVSLLIAAPAMAQQSIVMADCSEGGCSCLLTEMTESEATGLVGAPPPSGVTYPVLVLLESGYIWSGNGRGELDGVFNGLGQCFQELFTAILPRDGEWAGNVAERTVGAGCPAGVSEGINPLLDAIGPHKRMEWEQVFHPEKIRIAESQPGIVWERVNAEQFIGAMPMPNTPMPVSADWTSDLQDPEYVRSKVQIDIMGFCQVSAVVDFRWVGP